MKKQLYKVLKVVLKVAIIITLVLPMWLEGMYAYAEEARFKPRSVDMDLPEVVELEDEEEPENEETELRAPRIEEPLEDEPGELVEFDQYTKTYKVDETNYVTEISAVPNTFTGRNRKQELIDNRLAKDKSSYRNKANAYEVRLPEEMDEKNGVKLTYEGKSIEIMPQAGDFTRAIAEENAILYNNVYDGIDYQYTSDPDTVKKEIILNGIPEDSVFQHALKLTRKQRAELIDQAIHIYEGDELINVIMEPIIFDADGVVRMHGVDFALKDNEITIELDEDFLQSADTVYPLRITTRVTFPPINNRGIIMIGVQESRPNLNIGYNGYPYAGYDDGITSGNQANYNIAHWRTRTYIEIPNNILNGIPALARPDASIETASFSISHYTTWNTRRESNMRRAEFGLFAVDEPWNQGITWASQLNMSHTIRGGFRPATNTANENITWDITNLVQDWLTGIVPNHGFVIKTEQERDMQAEVWNNFNSSYSPNGPSITIGWTVPDPVDPNFPLNNATVVLHQITEKSLNSNSQRVRGFFASGMGTPDSQVDWWITPGGSAGSSTAASGMYSYKYPDTDEFTQQFPNGTRYKRKDHNWQSGSIFTNFSLDTAYQYNAIARKDGNSSSTKTSDRFLVYQVKRIDTLPKIARYYGVTKNDLLLDNAVQDTLAMAGNTIFVRNPRTTVPYNPGPLTNAQKRDLDWLLLGRGKDCEFGLEPINFNTGNFFMETLDAEIEDLGGDFSLIRTYNAQADGANGLFGRGWDFNYNQFINMDEDENINYFRGDGSMAKFTKSGNSYTAPAGYEYTLRAVNNPASSPDSWVKWSITDQDLRQMWFDANGILREIVSMQGFRTKLDYNENYQLRSITSPDGKRYTITMGTSGNTSGKITAVGLPNGATLRYGYDDNQRLTSFTDAEGGVIRYAYNNNHQMTAWYDANGDRIIHNTYDDHGRVTRQLDHNNVAATLTYTNGRTVVRDNEGNETTYEVDSRYRTTKITEPNGHVIDKGYNNQNQQTRTVDEQGNEVTRLFDARQNIIRETRVDGASRQMEYNTRNQLTKETNYDGSVTEYKYDVHGNLTETTYPDGTVTRKRYNADHNLIEEIDANGNSTKYSYDGPRMASKTDALGNVTRYSYNQMNQQIAETDPLGNITRTAYDRNGHMISETAPDGGVTEHTRDEANQVIATKDARGNTSTFRADAWGNLMQVRDPQGNTLTYTYDGNGNKTSETDADGNRTRYEYDENERLVREIDPEGAITSYTYDERGNQISVVSSLGGITKTVYDELGQVIKETSETGAETTHKYDIMGRVIETTIPDGFVTKKTYDVMGRVTEEITTEGIKKTYKYDANSNLLEETDQEGRTTKYEYDALDRVIKTTDPMGYSSTTEYDEAGQVIAETDKLGRTTKTKYDKAGRVIETTDALGNKEIKTYDLNGNVLTETDKNGNITKYTYNSLNLVTREENALGHVMSYAYTKTEAVSRETDALGGVTEYKYNKRNEPIEIKDALGNVSKIEYDLAGNETKTMYANGSTTTKRYDKAGLLIEEIDLNGKTTTHEYDNQGRIIATEDNTGTKATYEYDQFGRQIRETDAIAREKLIVYDNLGREIEEVDFNGNSTTNAYDDLDRIIETTDAEEKTTKLIYDAEGNVITRTEHDGTEWHTAYDANNQVIKETNPLGHVTEQQYDANGNVTKITLPNGVTNKTKYNALNEPIEETDGNGNTTKQTYDELGRVIKITNREGAVIELRYDAVGNLTKEKDAEGNITEHEYNNVGQKTKTISARGAETHFTYDEMGNVTKEIDTLDHETSYEYDLNDNVLKVVHPNGVEETYKYDVLNQLIEETDALGLTTNYTYDRRDDLIKETNSLGQETIYKYDIMHREIEITNAGGHKTTYTYDYRGNLASETNALGATTRYGYDAIDQQIREVDAKGRVTTVTYNEVGEVTSETRPGSRTTSYVYDDNGNILEVHDPMGSVTKTAYDKEDRPVEETNAMDQTTSYEYNANGQVIKEIDAEGKMTTYVYDPHGNIARKYDRNRLPVNFKYDLNDQLIIIEDPSRCRTTYVYDKMGNKIESVDADGKRVKYEYDAVGNMTSLLHPTGEVEASEYDKLGRQIKTIEPSGKYTEFTYDKLGNNIRKSYSSDEKDVRYTYDAIGNRTKMEDATGVTNYTHDILGNLTKVGQANGTISYRYDEVDNIAEMIYADGKSVKYAYDKNDRLVKVTDRSNKTITYTYNAIGQATQAKRSNGVVTDYKYHKASGQLTELKNVDKNNKTLSSFAYKRDDEGRIIQETANEQGSKVERYYSYNNSGELERFSEIEGIKKTTFNYQYDNSGNRTKLTRTGTKSETTNYKYNDRNQLVSENSTLRGNINYAYDKDGNLTEKSSGADKQTYEYNAENHLTMVRDNGYVLTATTYDGDNNRVFQVNRKAYAANPADQPGNAHQNAPGGNNASLNPNGDGGMNTSPTMDASQLATGDFSADLIDGDITADGRSETEHSLSKFTKEYPDPSDTIFWYTFSLGAIFDFTILNPGTYFEMAEHLSKIWVAYLNRYTLVVETTPLGSYSEADLNAMREAGLTEADLALIGEPAELKEAPNGLIGSVIPSSNGDPGGAPPGLGGGNPSKPGEQNPNAGLSDPLSKAPTGAPHEDKKSPIALPDDPEPGMVITYELSYLVNDLNRDHVEVLMTFGKRDELRSVDVYGLGRVHSEQIQFRYDGDKPDVWSNETYLYDGRGSVTQIADTSGSVKEQFRYEAFGNMTQGQPLQDVVYGFNGEEYNPLIDAQYLRARHLDMGMSRWLTQDSWLGYEEEPRSLNRYAYCYNDAVTYVDVTGHFPAHPSVSGRPVSGNTPQANRQDMINQVKSMQNRLNALGYTGSNGKRLVVDGVWGSHDRSAMYRFATVNNVPYSGQQPVKGSRIWNELFSSKANRNFIGPVRPTPPTQTTAPKPPPPPPSPKKGGKGGSFAGGGKGSNGNYLQDAAKKVNAMRKLLCNTIKEVVPKEIERTLIGYMKQLNDYPSFFRGLGVGMWEELIGPFVGISELAKVYWSAVKNPIKHAREQAEIAKEIVLAVANLHKFFKNLTAREAAEMGIGLYEIMHPSNVSAYTQGKIVGYALVSAAYTVVGVKAISVIRYIKNMKPGTIKKIIKNTLDKIKGISGGNVVFKLMKPSEAAKIIVKAERKGTALSKTDKYHRAASFVSEADLAKGKTFKFTASKDGVTRTLLQTDAGPGVNGYKGIYEYIIDTDMKVSHQLFIRNGKVTGKLGGK